MLNQQSLDAIFTNAHTAQGFIDKTVDMSLVQQAYDLAKMAPTAFNCSPMRLLFVSSKEAHDKLATALSPGNVDKTAIAPVTVIIANDIEFFNDLPHLFPVFDAKPIYSDNKDLAAATAARNGTLQIGYFITALRGLGLEVGPMSGFDNGKVDELFFAGSSWKSNIVMNIGYADVSKNYPRSPRFTFAEVSKTV